MYRYYPLARGHVTHVELSTPLTTAHFIGAPGGASYGLEWTPAHFDADLQAGTLSTTLSTPRYPSRYHRHVIHHSLNPLVMSDMAPYMSSRAVFT